MCVQIKGLIPFMSAIVHPIAFLCIFRVCNNLPSWSVSSLEEIITGKVSFSPKKEYLRSDGNGFNSSLGGWTLDGTGLFVRGGSSSGFGFQYFFSYTCEESKKG